MAAEAAAITFEAVDFESCAAMISEFFRQHPFISTIKVALFTRDRKPLGARIWQIPDGNVGDAIDIIAG